MRVGFIASAAAIAMMASACARAPVTPIRNPARRSVTTISGDVAGLKHTDTSKLGARGSTEGAQLGAQQGAAVPPGGGGSWALR